MNELKIKINGMHCESCEKVLTRALLKINNVKDANIKYNNEIATLFCDGAVSLNDVINAVRKAGYDAKALNENSSQDSATFKSYIDDFQQKGRVERDIFTFAIIAFFVLGALEILAYFGFFRNIPDFFSRYGYYLIFLVISVVISAASVWHIKVYGDRFSCMSGMMIGMTTGMISGFLLGMVVGATNGMFIGALVGIAAGMFVGIWTGKCCGVMGVMEGMMAGLMGGLMGAMTSLMLVNDNLKIIVPVLVFASSSILIGLDYMIYKESRDEKGNINKSNLLLYITLCFIITMLITFLMIYGPKSALFR